MTLQEQHNEETDLRPEEQHSNLPVTESEFPVYTAALITGIVAVALAQFGTGLEPSILAAGFVKPDFLSNHEYWRILTGATTHGSLAHLAMNGYAFYSFGRIFEQLTNRAHLAITFLLSAIGGGILSLIFSPDGISVGASGGIVGLIGYLVVYSYRRRQFISDEFRKSLLTNIGFLLIFGLVLYQVVDNYGHIGGLATGAIYAFLQVPSDAYTDPRKATRTAEAAGLAALGIYLAACAFSILLILKVI